jgi:hypothetical protein
MKRLGPGIDPGLSLAFIGSASVHIAGSVGELGSEALSITRLEGSRWRGGLAMELDGQFGGDELGTQRQETRKNGLPSRMANQRRLAR